MLHLLLLVALAAFAALLLRAAFGDAPPERVPSRSGATRRRAGGDGAR